MQNDFVPFDSEANPDGGAFGVPEGDKCSSLITKLIKRFAVAGARVAATRDYHPAEHCSFLEYGGHFPPHCVQGSPGSNFYGPVGDCIKRQQEFREARKVEVKGEIQLVEARKVEVFFKGFHEDVDSFGSFEYANERDTWDRIANNQDSGRLHGCSIHCWTGSVLLHCSHQKADINAPPDVLAAYRRKSLSDWLREGDVKRVFVCGLALDYCVLDTCLNGAKAGFEEIYLIMDASRAAHLQGIGQHGSGFLSDLGEIKEKLEKHQVRLIPSAALLDFLIPANPLKNQGSSASFPEQWGPFTLLKSERLMLELNLAQQRYKATGPKDVTAQFESKNVKLEGYVSPPSMLQGSGIWKKDVLDHLGVPEEATQFIFGHPLGAGDFSDKDRAYFGIECPSSAFLIYGGFMFLDSHGEVLATLALAVGDGLRFEYPQKWLSKYSKALEERWQPVTIPLLRNKGVSMYAWIGPREGIADTEKNRWTLDCPCGGFVFLYHDDPAEEDERDVFFALQPFRKEICQPSVGRAGTQDEEMRAHAENARLHAQPSTLEGIQSSPLSRPVMQDEKVQAPAEMETVKEDENEEAVTPKYVSEADHMINVFKDFDEEKSGSISETDMAKAISFLCPNLSDALVQKLFLDCGASKEGRIDYTLFCRYLAADF
jgi:nicotinamidase-related amidase